jgi:hypothetical protein
VSDTHLNVTMFRCETPKFPGMCPACGESTPTDTFQMVAGLGEHVHLGLPRRRYRAEIPVCAACRGELILGRWLMRVVTLTAVTLSIGFAAWTWTQPHHQANPILRFGGLVSGGAFLILHMCLWPPMWITAGDQTVTYTFLRDEYAREFARINGKAEPQFDFLDQN